MSHLTHKLTALAFLFTLILFPARTILAGDLDSPAAPTNATSAMFTLEDIFNRLDSGAAGSKRAGPFVEPGAGPTAGTGRTLDEVMGKAPVVDNVNGAVAADVLSGKSFWGLRTGAWGERAGSMANVGKQDITPDTAPQTITQGYHDGTGRVAGEPNLVTGNIHSGVSIFGVAGNSNVVNTSSGDATAGDIRTGKKAWVDGAEITGTLDPDAIPCSGTRWSNTGEDSAGRWCDNNNGTVTDLFGHNGKGKGLVWLRDASWGGKKAWRAAAGHDDAHTRAGLLKAGDDGAGLTDGSVAGDWRLPTFEELKALTQGTHLINNPGKEGPFNVPLVFYWTSSTYADDTAKAWGVHPNNTIAKPVEEWDKSDLNYGHVWPVR